MVETFTRDEILSTNPATGEELARVAVTSKTQLEQVVSRAWAAFHGSGWKSLQPHKKALILQAIADGLAAEKESLARLQMLDNGKPLAECRGMVDAAGAIQSDVFYSCGTSTTTRSGQERCESNSK